MNIDIDSIKRRLLVKYPFFGSVIANLNYVESRDIYSNGSPTAGTDGNTIYYHPDFIRSLTDEQQVFIFAHEVCHVAFDHIYRSEGKDSVIWNIATDAVINAMLKKDGLSLVEGVVDIAEAIHYDAEQMYEKLLENKKGQDQSQDSQNGSNKKTDNENGQSGQNSDENDKQNQNGQDGEDSKMNSASKKSSEGQSDSGSKDAEEKTDTTSTEEEKKDVGHDSHNLWKKAIEKKKMEEKQDQEDQTNGIGKNAKEEKRKKELEEAIKKISELGEEKAFKKNIIDRKKQLDELRASLSKQAVGAGNSMDSSQRTAGQIGSSLPLIDWRRILKETVTYDIDWSYRNATIEDGVITPYLEELPHPETEILLDTSGSIDEILLRNFLRECKNILQTSKIKVGCFDTRFYGFTEIRNEEDIERFPLQGGGGTDFDVAVEAFTRRVENKIIFTDGDASMPDKTLDVIWIVFSGIRIHPHGGKVIQIGEEQLEELSRHCDYYGRRR